MSDERRIANGGLLFVEGFGVGAQLGGVDEGGVWAAQQTA
jgi:hypothetical protein